MHPTVRRAWAWSWRVILTLGRNNVFGVASQLAYSLVFALFPFLLGLVALGSYLPEHDLLERLLAETAPFVPRSGYDLIVQNLHAVTARRSPGLASLGFALGLWSSSGAIHGLLSALNLIYGIEDSRSVLKTRALSLGLTVVADLTGILACLLLIWGGAVGRFVSTALGHPQLYSEAWALFRWPAAAGLFFASMVGLYWILPDLRLRLRDVLWGALFATALWVIATRGFSAYLARFPDFGAAYGSLGAVIVLLTWLWINGLLLILGGQLNALLAEARGLKPERRRAANQPSAPVNSR